MQLTYDISIMPILFLVAVIICLTVMATHMYIKTNIRADLFLAIAFGGISLLSVSLIFQTGEQVFWGRPYQLALLIVVGTGTAIHWLLEKTTFINKFPFIFVTVATAVTLIMPSSYFTAVITSFVLLIAAGAFYVIGTRGYGISYTRIGLYVLLAICALLGGLIATNAFAMLYALGLVSLMIFEFTRYLNRNVGFLKNVGTYSITDPLTKLYNKGYLLKKSAQMIEQKPISVIFCDIDNFKQLNDTKGHDFGDEILIGAGALLKKIVKKKAGIAFRFGGEELVAVSYMDLDDTVKIAEEFRQALEKELKVTVSIGVANSTEISKTYRPNLEAETIKLADEKLYIAKRTGKNKVVFTK